MDPKDLGFRPARMFRWLSPLGLVLTGAKVAISGTLSRYADKREVEAAIPSPPVPDLSSSEEVWVDFIADTGDGFNPTYEVARQAAKSHLSLRVGDQAHTTQRGQILVMGGDQVYPAADEDRYLNQFIGPYRAALPWTTPGANPRLFAIPGNHDWYDGLTAFMRLLCRGRWVGGWLTQQARSYFAIKLPGRWWLWGIDIAFDAYIDDPQLSYFGDLASGALGATFPKVEPGDRIILCTGKPSWVHEGLAGDEQYKGTFRARRNLEFFEREIVRAHGAEVRLALSGDLHHYARYRSEDGRRHRITAGGGGAYLYPTHVLDERVHWRDADPPADPTTYHRAAIYPDARTSKRLRWGALWVPKTNPSFMGLTALIYLLIFWVIMFSLSPGGRGAAEALRRSSWWRDALALLRNPAGTVLCLAVLIGMYAFADALRRGQKVGMGVIHAVAQLATAVTVAWGAARIPGLAGRPYLAVVAGLVAAGGGLGGSLVMGLYLVIAQLFKRHPNENFSSQHIQDYKNFLRLRIRTDGTVTVFPVGLDKVPRHWRLATGGTSYESWLEPIDGEVEPYLIEPPIDIA